MPAENSSVKNRTLLPPCPAMEGRNRRSFRSSVRSRGSSSTSDITTREKIKDCCRKLVAFMCTQVGVGGLVVGYTVVGAFTFQYIETLKENESFLGMEEARNKTAADLFEVVCRVNVFNKSSFDHEVSLTLKRFQDKVANETKLHGYNGRRSVEIWTFPAALMFCLSIITMIGYGNMVVKSDMGKCITVIYAVFGIPLYILYFMNMGEVLAGCFRWLYTWCYECTTEREEDEPPRRIIVPSSASLWVIAVYVFTGAIMFAAWEKWSYLDSTYFCVTSLCKIGLGDFVPGANISESQSGNHYKLVVNFVYMLIGLGLVAMCFNLMREEIRVKVSEFKEDMDATARRMLGSSSSPVPIRLYSVTGYDGRSNDVIYCQPRSCSKGNNSSVVVFFGGDMQDFSENMQSHRDSKNYLKWNLEDTALIMQKKFPHSHFVTIRPSRIEYKTISCYGNFVPSNNCGAPDHTPMNFALQHLEKLLEHVSDRLRSMSESELNAASISYNPAPICEETDTEDNTIQTSDDLNVKPRREEPRLDEPLWWRDDLQLQHFDISVIGFSKGCVVLNQFLYEFHYLKTLTPDDQVPMGIVHRIKDMYWLDGGHSGGKNTWITSRPLLETLARLDIKIHVHVSPYQIQDDRRPWIKKEEKAFSDLLKRLGAPIERCVHFENVTPNLYSHFDVITAFKENDDSIATSN